MTYPYRSRNCARSGPPARHPLAAPEPHPRRRSSVHSALDTPWPATESNANTRRSTPAPEELRRETAALRAKPPNRGGATRSGSVSDRGADGGEPPRRRAGRKSRRSWPCWRTPTVSASLHDAAQRPRRRRDRRVAAVEKPGDLLAHIGEHYPAARICRPAAFDARRAEGHRRIGRGRQRERIDADPNGWRLSFRTAHLQRARPASKKHHAADEAADRPARPAARPVWRPSSTARRTDRRSGSRPCKKAAEKPKLADWLRKAREGRPGLRRTHPRNALPAGNARTHSSEAAIGRLRELTRTGGDSVRFLSFRPTAAGRPQKRRTDRLGRRAVARHAGACAARRTDATAHDHLRRDRHGRVGPHRRCHGRNHRFAGRLVQVVDITHLPQVASKGAGGTSSSINATAAPRSPASDDERITEIAKMLSGSEITDATIAQARILLGRNGEPHPRLPAVPTPRLPDRSSEPSAPTAGTKNPRHRNDLPKDMDSESLLALAAEKAAGPRRPRRTASRSRLAIGRGHPHLVGSLRTGLLMTHRDADLHIYSPGPQSEGSFAAMARIAPATRVSDASRYANLLDAEDRCIEWHAQYADTEGDLWQIDMIHMSVGSPWEGISNRWPTASPRP